MDEISGKICHVNISTYKTTWETELTIKFLDGPLKDKDYTVTIDNEDLVKGEV